MWANASALERKKYAVISLDLHRHENASGERDAEKWTSAAIIMEMIILSQLSSAHVTRLIVLSHTQSVRRRWLGAKSIVIRQALSQALSSLYARNVVVHIALRSVLMCNALSANVGDICRDRMSVR